MGGVAASVLHEHGHDEHLHPSDGKLSTFSTIDLSMVLTKDYR